MGVVVSQALAGVWFYKLFSRNNRTAAWSLAIFGIMNAVAIISSVAFMAPALAVAGDPALANRW